MKANSDKAVEYFNSGFNCAQSVFSTFAEKYGLPEDLALKIASGLGGGFRSGEICGAVSGAVLAIGLKLGQCIAEDAETKKHCNAKTEEFIKIFRDTYGAITCRDMLGCDISTEAGRARAVEGNLFETICVERVKQAVNLLEKLGY